MPAPKNKAYTAHRDARRRKVAGLRLRGLTQQEIAGLLPRGDEPILNPKTGEPYDLATVNRDLKHLEAEWKAQAAGDIAELKGNHLAELREVRRRAWQGTQLNTVMRSLEHEARVLGIVGEKDTAEAIGALGDSFLAGVHTVKQMAGADLSE